MQELFNDQIRDLLGSDFPLAFDAMRRHRALRHPSVRRTSGCTSRAPQRHAAGGPGNGHLDPNLTYAHDLAELLLEGDDYRFGAVRRRW